MNNKINSSGMTASRRGLIVIDPQRDFIDPGGVYSGRHSGITQIDAAKKNIDCLLEKLMDIPIAVVYSNYVRDQFGKDFSICIPGTEGHLFDIDVKDSLTLIPKTSHSAFSSDLLSAFLDQNRIRTLYIAGFLAEYCVRSTAIDALRKKYEVVLIEDCIGTGDDVQDRRLKMFEELKASGVSIIQAEEMFTAIQE